MNYHPKPRLEAVRRSFDPRDRSALVSLDRNEWVGPMPPLPELLGGISLRDVTDYPTLEPLYERLAAWLQVPRGWLLLGPGSDSLIRSMFEVFVRAGDRVVQLWPSYAMYEVYAGMYQAATVRVEFDADRGLPVERLLAALTPGTRLLALANPNQPTGTVLAPADLERVLGAAREAGALVLVDEAYYYFHDRSALELLAQHPHVLVTRTFSKAMGMAGVRVGIGIAHPELIGWLDRVRPTCEISGLAHRLVEYVLEHPQLPWDNARQSHQGQVWLAERLTSLGLRSTLCPANFMLIHLPPGYAREEGLRADLAQRGYLIRGAFSAPCLRGCLRVSTGPAQVMEGFWQAFKTAYAP